MDKEVISIARFHLILPQNIQTIFSTIYADVGFCIHSKAALLVMATKINGPSKFNTEMNKLANFGKKPTGTPDLVFFAAGLHDGHDVIGHVLISAKCEDEFFRDPSGSFPSGQRLQRH